MTAVATCRCPRRELHGDETRVATSETFTNVLVSEMYKSARRSLAGRSSVRVSSSGLRGTC
jgi:hypothetical protein